MIEVLPSHRRALALARSGHICVIEEPLRAPGPGELLVEVHVSAISPGTELGHLRGRERSGGPQGPFRPFGYQHAGRIVALGEGCRGFDVGQRVACMGAGYAQHATYACVPQHLAVGLPDEVDDEDAAFIALAATAMQAVRRGEVAFGEEVAVLGLGPLGQLVAQVARLAGAHVLAIDPLGRRAEIARRLGADAATDETGEAAVRRAAAFTAEQGMDCGFLCFGGEATAALQDLVRMMKQAPDTHRWGRIVIVGGARITHRFGADLGNLDLRSAARTGPGYHDPDYERGRDYPPVFVRWSTRAHLQLFVRWVREGKLRCKELITDRVSLEDAPRACEALIDAPGEHLGTVIRYREAG
ncbi:MAG TPA: zinc-binding alcohol dehydrogenase [Limnochordia bacterium]